MSGLRLLAGGDVFIGGRMKPLLEEGRLEEVLGDLKPLLATADLTIANFEAAIGDFPLDGTDSESLVSSPAVAQALRSVGIRAVGLANNHALDLGTEGLKRTLAVLKSAGLLTVGAGTSYQEMILPLQRPLGLDMAILAYFGSHRRVGRPGTNGARLELMVSEVAEARQRASNVIVMLHWGRLDQHHPTRAQVDIAHSLIDAGATAIIGAGPHCLMPVERYRHGVIAYSLGNLAFDMRPTQRRLACLLDVIVADGSIESVDVHPVLSDAQCCTRRLTETNDKELYDSVRSLVVSSLGEVLSDSLTAKRTLQRFREDPVLWIVRRVRRDRRAHSFSDYARSVLALVKEKLSLK